MSRLLIYPWRKVAAKSMAAHELEFYDWGYEYDPVWGGACVVYSEPTAE